jgi:hypothetical protein
MYGDHVSYKVMFMLGGVFTERTPKLRVNSTFPLKMFAQRAVVSVGIRASCAFVGIL